MDWKQYADELESGPLSESLFVFGLHKSGSTLLNKMVKSVCANEKIALIDVPGTAFHEGLMPAEWGNDKSLVPVFLKNAVFCGFRFFPSILADSDINIRKKKFVLLVRDPRDALVSQYYSYGGKYINHEAPRNNGELFLSKFRKTENLYIGDYVLQAADDLYQKIKSYSDNLNFELGLILRYEDLYFDKYTSLKAVFTHFNLEVDDATLEKVSNEHDIRPVREDKTKHIRKGTPGDHVCKLKPNTILKLNDKFSVIVKFFGYDFNE